MQMIRNLVMQYDSEMKTVLEDQELLMFTMSWHLTWFAHSLSKMEDIIRIYDYLLCSPPIQIVYLAASVSLIPLDSNCVSNHSK